MASDEKLEPTGEKHGADVMSISGRHVEEKRL